MDVAAVCRYADALTGFLWPNVCPGCGRRLAHRHWPACPGCLAAISRVEPEELAGRLSGRGLPADRWRRIFSLWMFDKHGLVQDLHHGWKYRGNERLGVQLGIWLGKRLVAERIVDAVSPGRELLLPVPLAKARLLERGYNQSAVLCVGIARATRQTLAADVLERTRFTRSQVGLSLEKRRRNVDGAFAVRQAGLIAGRDVWLVDDVITTGATLWAASRPLFDAGANSVSILTLSAARTV